jgi:hypothetical protein
MTDAVDSCYSQKNNFKSLRDFARTTVFGCHGYHFQIHMNIAYTCRYITFPAYAEFWLHMKAPVSSAYCHMYACTRAYVCIDDAHVHVYTSVYIYIYIYIYIYTYIHTCCHMYTCTHVYAYTDNANERVNMRIYA